MIKSMTGFGRSEYSDGRRSITCEMRAVNHRYCDISVSMPKRYSFAEEKIKSLIRETVSRGKIDVSISVENITEYDMRVRLNMMVAEQYKTSLDELKARFDLKGDVTLPLMAGLPDVMKTVPEIENEDEFILTFAVAVKGAVEKLDAMRAVEGEKLKEDLLARGDKIKCEARKIKVRIPDIVKGYRERLKERLYVLLDGGVDVPEERIAVEVAVFADKCDITEELVRLDSHMDQMSEILLEGSKAVGKRLDFLVQEMNRETNTIGSKANDLETTNIMLAIKSEVEKIREQVQNIE